MLWGKNKNSDRRQAFIPFANHKIAQVGIDIWNPNIDARGLLFLETAEKDLRPAP
jgi:hypothetical protein